MTRVALLCLDADDTLWGHESYFQDAARRYRDALSDFAAPERIDAALTEAEERNLQLYGYGVKGFTLSMLETALEIAGDDLPGQVTRIILGLGRELMRHPVTPLAGVAETLPALAERVALVLVTKGDLFHQESKLAASGLGGYFSGVEIVSDKTATTYLNIFRRYHVAPGRAAMAGNSLRSDVWPALRAGAWAALVPSDYVWAHEHADEPQDESRYARLNAFAELSDWLDRIGED